MTLYRSFFLLSLKRKLLHLPRKTAPNIMATEASPPAWPASPLSHLSGSHFHLEVPSSLQASAYTPSAPEAVVESSQTQYQCMPEPPHLLHHLATTRPPYPSSNTPSHTVPSAWTALPVPITCLVPCHHSGLSFNSVSSGRPHPVPVTPPTPFSLICAPAFLPL